MIFRLNTSRSFLQGTLLYEKNQFESVLFISYFKKSKKLQIQKQNSLS